MEVPRVTIVAQAAGIRATWETFISGSHRSGGRSPTEDKSCPQGIQEIVSTSFQIVIAYAVLERSRRAFVYSWDAHTAEAMWPAA